MTATPDTAPVLATAAEVAAMLDVDPKTFRRYLRDETSTFRPVGQGKRYGFDAKEIAWIKVHFPAWQAKHTRGAKKTDDVQPTEAAGASRAAALDAALRDAGLHVSQHAA